MKVLVTGGGGFLGQAIIDQLLVKNYEVVTLNRGAYPALQSKGVTCITGDIGTKQDVLQAARNCDAIIHTAAKAGVWGDYHEYFITNVIGTRNVLESCLELGIRKLVYTSSPSVIFAGEDQMGVDEGTPYPKMYLAHYPQTKAEAEKLVIAAQSHQLDVVSLRPHLIWGPGDNHLAPRLIASQKAGRLKFIGNKETKIDAVFIDNAAQAHIIALEKLYPGSPIAGNTYFITNHEPWPTGYLINNILKSAGYDPVTSHIPAKLAYFVGWGMEFFYTFFKIKKEPFLTRFVARQLATSHWFDNKRAQRDLGYNPEVSMDEGMKRLRQSYQDSR